MLLARIVYSANCGENHRKIKQTLGSLDYHHREVLGG